MKRYPIWIMGILTILVSVGCSYNPRSVENQSEQVRLRQLLSGQYLVTPQVPFVVRTFNPYSNGKWIGSAISYGCYRDGQAPGVLGPSKEEILEDLEIISKHWNLIRVYNADNDTERILEVISEHNLPIKVMLGVWLENETNSPMAKESNINNALKCINLANRFKSTVIAINVGNETQVFWSWHKLSSKDLLRYVRVIRQETSVPITTADDYNYWNKPESAYIANEIDFVMVHAYPLWNGKNLRESIPWLETTISAVQQNHPDKLLVLGEVGWATSYNASKIGDGEQGSLIKGEVSLAAQEEFLYMYHEWIERQHICSFLFEAFDEPWKGGGASSPPYEIEKNWGLFYHTRLPKLSFINYLAKTSHDNIINNPNTRR